MSKCLQNLFDNAFEIFRGDIVGSCDFLLLHCEDLTFISTCRELKKNKIKNAPLTNIVKNGGTCLLHCIYIVFLLKQNIYCVYHVASGLYVPHIFSLAKAKFLLALAVMVAQY